MKQSNYPHGFRSSLFRNTLLALLLWTTAVIGSWWWSYDTYQQHVVELAKIEADTNINKDWSFPLWAASHGGIYVPPDENTQPNPYLAHIPDRDIVTDKGKRLTLMDPAYMLRQIMEHYSGLFGVKGRITSLVLTNPNNAPDEWETAALKAFQQGVKEAVTVTTIDGKPYLRLIRPMLMEKGCMKCHANTGIKVGGIRGGISSAVPMEPLYLASRAEIDNLSLMHGIVWLLGVGTISFVVRRTGVEGANRKMAEEKLRQAYAYNRSLIEASLDPLVTISSDGKITDVNAATEAVTGYSREALIGNEFLNYFTEPDKARTGYQEVFREGVVHDYPLEIRHRDGHVTPVLYNASLYSDEEGKVIGVFAAARDISVRKRALEALQQSEAQLKEAQRIAHLGNWNLDLTDNALAWSDEIFRIFEIDPHKFGATYEAFLNTIHPDDRERVNNAYTESVKNKTPYDISHRLLMKDGRIKYVNERCETYYATDGKPLRSVGTVHDITESKVAEEEIRKLNQELERRVAERTAQLEAANKELEAFSYSVSHDLRTPLRAIDGFSRILLDDYPDKLDEEGKRYLHIVRDNTMRMGQLIDDILSFSRMGRRELAAQPLNLNRLTQEVFDELRPGAANRVLKLELKPLPPVQGDQAMLRQVLVNLLSNAIKFTRPRPEAIIEVGATPGGKEIVFYVKDNGVGFDMQYAGKLFGVFQRLHAGEEFEGTGIGLANVKRIIARHGGRVWAEGKINEGATIYFTLPQGELA